MISMEQDLHGAGTVCHSIPAWPGESPLDEVALA